MQQNNNNNNNNDSHDFRMIYSMLCTVRKHKIHRLLGDLG